MATPRKALTKTKTAPAGCRFTILIDGDSTALFDEYVTDAQAQRFIKLVETIGPLPEPPKTATTERKQTNKIPIRGPVLDEDAARIFVDRILDTTQPDEPESLIRLLVFLRKYQTEAFVKDGFDHLLQAAFKRSGAFYDSLDKFVESLGDGKAT